MPYELISVLLLLLAQVSTLTAGTVDRVAAVVDQQVIALSEVDQLVEIRFFLRRAGASDDDYRHDVLEALISQALRLRDVQRFGTQEIPRDSIESRVQEMQKRFASPAEFDSAMTRVDLSADEVRALAKRQLQVESYVLERFAPLIFVSSEEIESYYRETWSRQRREREQLIPPLADARVEIRSQLRSLHLKTEVDRWTDQLRARANVDIYTWR